MVSEPGSRLDFGTFIAYLIPGYILELLMFCIGDAIHTFITGKSFLTTVSWGATEIAAVSALLTLISYILGLLLDNIAHPLTLKNELRIKRMAYEEAVEQFKGLVKSDEVNKILYASKNDPADLNKRTLFIDSLFYRLSSPEIWARQNWHWAFYEFSRQVRLLFVPVVFAVSFYVTLVVVISTSPSFHPSYTALISAGTALLATVVGWFGPRRLLKRANDTDCKVYYRHRAWVVFAYLIEVSVLARLDKPEEKANKAKSSLTILQRLIQTISSWTGKRANKGS